MAMRNLIKEPQKSDFLSKISLICGFGNILLFVLIIALSDYRIETLAVILFLAFALSLSIGLVAGIAAFINKRAWIGLALTIMMVIFLGVSLFVYTFLFCCEPPPQLR